MRLRNFGSLGVVAILVLVATSRALSTTPQSPVDYEEIVDLVLTSANESDFPSLYGYGNFVDLTYGISQPDGTLSLVVSRIELSSSTLTNLTVGIVSKENRTETSTAPSIASHNKTVYVSWAEAGGILLVVIENGTIANTTKIGGFASYYNAPSIATYGKEMMLSFICGNQTGNATLVVVNRNESGNFQIEVVDTLPFGPTKPRKTACGYDIYGNAHIFLGNQSTIEHYFSNGTEWHHEKLGLGFSLVSEPNLRFVNNLCYLGFWVSNGVHMNSVLGKGVVGDNGSLGEIEHMILSTSAPLSQEELYFTPRVYLAPSGSRTLYAAWSEKEDSGNLTGKVGKIVGSEFVGASGLGNGKICGIFAEQDKLYVLAIENGTLHYKIFKIHRENPVLTILETAHTKITLGWSRCYDEDFAWYEVHVGNVENFTPSLGTLYATIYDPEQTVWIVENLKLGMEYFFLIGVRFTDNQTVYSNFVSYKTPTPVERVNATVSDVRPDGFTVSWEKKECLNFELHLAITPDFEDEIIVSLSNTTTRYSFDSLEPATTYFVYVRSIGFYGEYADSQTISVLTTPEMLDAVAEVEKITISWRAPSPRFFEKTEVYMARDSSNVFDTASLLTVIYEPSISTLTITTGYEEINTAFYFGIIVYNTLWQSAASNVVSNTTFLPQIPRVSLSKYEILNATSVKIYLPATDYAYFSRLEIHLSLEENFTFFNDTATTEIYTQGESTYLLYGL
ncbi:MAG: fibronectin type III domain-containing protein, partial [Thermoplasmata archaeon]